MHALALTLLTTLVPAAHAEGGYGMTWGKVSHDSTYGVDYVSCHGGGADCNAYRGDTQCFKALPILCINVDGSTNPGVTTGTYSEWAAGNIANTLPIPGFALGSISHADGICEDYFGTGWRMAEHHDGWGWGFKALGNVRDDTRMWVYIDDQPGNCWD